MPTYMSRLSALTRPTLLVRAARHRTLDFKREITLRRILQGAPVPAPGQAFDSLFALEREMNSARSMGGAAYSPARHVDLLAALIYEARIAELRIAA